ncbi:MAG: enoyl-CoA hydratase/isomerase family protein [Chloroflexi bacterium]|nr:enoyl-CoA hydratase/isomerase family protein [Chloroflexota bacterium]
MGEATIYEKKNHMAILTMNRPEAMNAMNAAMRSEMGEALKDFRDDNDSWVLILTGAGDRAFSAGMDLREMAARLSGGGGPPGGRPPGGGPPGGGPPGGSPPAQPLSLMGHTEIWKPIIAAINGVAVGGGLETALACDIRIAADTARMGLSEPKRGIVPGGGGMARLPRLVPLGIAMEILLTGDLITAQEAYRISLVNQILPPAELMPAAIKMAERIIDCAPLAVRSIKETVMKARDIPSLEEALKVRFGGNINATEDAREGTRAFNEKRKPVWKGQ